MKVSQYVRRNILGLVAIFLALNAGAYAITRPQGNVGAPDLNVPSVSKVVQLRVTGKCTDGQSISLIRRNGRVECTDAAASQGAQPPGQISSVNVTDGLLGGGSQGDITIGVDPSVIQNRVTGSCPLSQAIQSIGQDGTVQCGAKGTGTVTELSVAPGSGLTASPNPITTTGTLGTDFQTIQKRVGGACIGTQAVQDVDSGGAVDCSPDLQRLVTGTCTGTQAVQSVTAAGGVGCSPSLQQRVTGTCTGTKAVQSVAANGTVGCTANDLQNRVTGSCGGAAPIQSIAADGTVTCSSAFPGVSQAVAPGGSATLFDFAGMLVTAECSDPPDKHALVKVSSNGGAGAFVIYEVRSTLKNPEGGTVLNGGPAVPLADTGGTDQVTFNVAASGSPTHLLDGSLLVWSANGTNTGNCQFTGSAIAH